MPLAWVAVAGMGAALGPALRARIFRHAVPAERPTRHDCPACGTGLVADGPRGLVAVLSPSGRCPACQARVGPPPGAVEAVGAVVLAVLVLRAGSALQLAAACWVAAFGVALAFVDGAVHRLPDRLTLPAYAGALVLLSLAAAIDHRPGTLGTAVGCGLALAAWYLALAVVSPAGMGLGDGKLALSVGTLLGWSGWTTALLGAASGFLLAGLYAAAALMLGKAGRKDHIPHGPFMLLGALSAIALAG